MENGLYVSDEHAEWSCELPGIFHLSELDSLIKGSHS